MPALCAVSLRFSIALFCALRFPLHTPHTALPHCSRFKPAISWFALACTALVNTYTTTWFFVLLPARFVLVHRLPVLITRWCLSRGPARVLGCLTLGGFGFFLVLGSPTYIRTKYIEISTNERRRKLVSSVPLLTRAAPGHGTGLQEQTGVTITQRRMRRTRAAGALLTLPGSPLLAQHHMPPPPFFCATASCARWDEYRNHAACGISPAVLGTTSLTAAWDACPKSA